MIAVGLLWFFQKFIYADLKIHLQPIDPQR